MNFSVRRATTDDLAQLVALWQAAQLPSRELEKRFTEFQIAEDADGNLAGAIGLQIAGQEGKIHNETFADFGLTDTLRPLLWQRLQMVAQNHGLFRVWTEESAPFWKKDAGFSVASNELLKELPAGLGASQTGWLMLQLREIAASPISLAKEFEKFREMSKAETEKAFRHARALKILATIIAVLLFLFVLIGGIMLLKNKPLIQFTADPEKTTVVPPQ